MAYSIYFGHPIAQIREDFPTARRALARFDALWDRGAMGIMVLDPQGRQLDRSSLAQLARTEEGSEGEDASATNHGSSS